MAKTMRNVVITCILLIALAGCACALVMTGGCSNMTIPGIGNPFASAQVAAANAAIDSSGIKDRIENQLYSHVDQIAAVTGLSTEAVYEGIEDLAIQEWTATELPSNATKTGSYSVNAEGTQVGVTTYDNAGVVTVDAYGQEVTLAVPDSAQQYLYLLPMLDSMR